jgi:hypothetical protein
MFQSCKASTGAVIGSCFSSSTCFSSPGVQRRGSGPSWVNLRYKDFVLGAYESIHNWQDPTKPRNFLNSYFVPGRGRPVIPSSLSGPILHWPLLIKCPRYFTSASANCNLFFEIQSAQLSRKFIKLMVVLITSPWLSPDRSTSSTYWRRHMWSSNLNFSNWKQGVGKKQEPGGLALAPEPRSSRVMGWGEGRRVNSS